MLHLAKFSLEWLNGLGRVVYEVDAELVSRIYKLVKGIVNLFTLSVHVSRCRALLVVIHLVLDNILLVRKICHDDDVHYRQLFVRGREFAILLNLDGRLCSGVSKHVTRQSRFM